MRKQDGTKTGQCSQEEGHAGDVLTSMCGVDRLRFTILLVARLKLGEQMNLGFDPYLDLGVQSKALPLSSLAVYLSRSMEETN